MRCGALNPDGADWCGGPSEWRVAYTAGYDAIPDDVQEACAGLVAQMFLRTKRDPGRPRVTSRIEHSQSWMTPRLSGAGGVVSATVQRRRVRSRSGEGRT